MHFKTAFFVMTSTALLAGASALIAACGDDDASSATTDGGTDATTDQAKPGTDSGGTDSGPSDAGGGDAADAASCGPEGSACKYNGTKDGLCKAGVCVGCVEPTDDNACKTAYASKIDGGAVICENAVCTAGNCHTNANCTGGQICGLSVPNTCAKCASDAECKTAYGTDYVCNKTTGGCITNGAACTAVGSACLGSPGSICCSTAGGNTCAAGNCCADADCTDPGKPTCTNRTCTGCPAVTNGQYYVDPDVADDTAATGGPSCPFKTITKALGFIGNPGTASTINVKANATIAAGETFPLIVPANITVKGDTAQPATVNVPADQIGFVLRGANGGLDHLVLDGQAHVAASGVVVQTGASSTTTIVQYVTVKNMKSDGIVVQNATGQTSGGGVKLGPAVSSTGNGTTLARASGLVVKENGSAVITGTAGAETHFDTNTDTGIKVVDLGQITVTGDVGATPPTTGTVTANGNFAAGLWVAQTPGNTVPQNVVTGLTAWQTTTGSGTRLLAGSSVKLRSSSALGSSLYGVHVTPFQDGVTVVNDVSKLDLGTNTTTEAGKNVLQAATGASPNMGAGICLAVTQNVGVVLNAQGNTFTTVAKNATADCSGGTPPAIGKNFTCLNAQSVGVIGNAVNTNSVATQACAQQFSAQ